MPLEKCQHYIKIIFNKIIFIMEMFQYFLELSYHDRIQKFNRLVASIQSRVVIELCQNVNVKQLWEIYWMLKES